MAAATAAAYYDNITGLWFDHECLLHKLLNIHKALVIEFLWGDTTLAEIEQRRSMSTQAYASAARYARMGNRTMMEVFIRQALRYQGELYVENDATLLCIDKEDETLYLEDSLNSHLIHLRTAVMDNDATNIKWYSKRVESFAAMLSRDVSEEIQRIKSLPIIINHEQIDKDIENAFEYADKGDQSMMDYYVRKVYRYTEAVSYDVSDRLRSVVLNESMRIPHIMGKIDSMLRSAMRNATRGDKELMDSCIHSAEWHAVEIDLDVTGRVDAAREAYDRFRRSMSF